LHGPVRPDQQQNELGRQNMRLRFKPTYVVLAMLCVMYFITYVDRVNIGTAASEIQKELGLSNTQLGLVFSAFAYPYLLLQIIGGWIGDRFGPRKSLFWCGMVWAAATIMTGFVSSLSTLFIARVALGFGEGATFPTATRAMQHWTPANKRGFAQGLTHACARLGNAVTPPLIAALMAWLTWRGSFVALGLVSLVWGVINNYNLDIRNSALFASGVFLAGVVGDSLGGILSDRILKRTGDVRLARLGVIVTGFAGALLSLVPILFIHDITTVALCLSGGFFFAELVIGPIWSVPMDIAPKYSGTAAGLMNSGSALAAIVSPLVAGYVIDVTGNWYLPFLMSMGLLLLGGFCAFLMRPETPFEATAASRLLDARPRPASAGKCRPSCALTRPTGRGTSPSNNDIRA
jgi:MFS family permease